MDTADLFASEWHRLQEKRQQLIREANRLNYQLNSLAEEPTMRELLAEKTELKKRIPQLRDNVEVHKAAIERNRYMLERRRRAATDKGLQHELAAQLSHRRDRLTDLERLRTPKVILEIERRMVFEIEAPIEEVEKLYQRMNAEEEQELQAAQRILDETMARIAVMEEHYRQTKQCLEEAVREDERRRQACRAEEIEWATQSRRHLEWMLEHEPLYKDDIVRRYKARFPTDKLSDLFPSSPAQESVVQRSYGNRRKSPSNTPASPVVKATPAIPQQPWRIWITFNANDPGQELPQDKLQFLRNLQLALDRVSYHSLNVKLVYDKLTAVGRMSKQQRQEMNKVIGADLLGWKILRVGKKHRLFLSIDEERRHMRFLPCPRKKSYSHH